MTPRVSATVDAAQPPVESPQPFLSIIIPAYNEEHRLPTSLDQILAWRETVPYEVEIDVVENGSTDRTTDVAVEYAREHAGVRILHSAKGKGVAVREGMLNGRGDFLFICDSDLSMPISEVEKFLPPQLVGFDVAIGSREAPGAVRYNEPWYRHWMGRVFNLIVRVLAIPGFQDTQCGFKLFRRDIAVSVFSRQQMGGWAFDVEALYLALRDGAKVAEVPIHWYFNADSRVEPVRDTINMVWDVLRIRANDRRGLYDRRVSGQPAAETQTA